MSADDDTFDIDIYGDESQQDYAIDPDDDFNPDGHIDFRDDAAEVKSDDHKDLKQDDSTQPHLEVNTSTQHDNAESDLKTPSQDPPADSAQQLPSNSAQQPAITAPNQVSTQQGTKRPASSSSNIDGRPLDQGASAALRIDNLNWWTTEDDFRGWANQAGVESEFRDISFNEHKINGRSKGEAFIELASAQAATSMKRRIDVLIDAKLPAAMGFGGKRIGVSYALPEINPYKVQPKDVPKSGNYHNNNNFNRPSSGGAYNNSGAYNQNNLNSNRGAFNNRGSFNNNRGNFNGNAATGYNNSTQNSTRNFGAYNGMQAGFNPIMASGMMAGNMMGRGGGFNNMGGAGFNNLGRGGYGHMGGMNGMGGMGMSMMNGMNMGGTGMGGMGMGMGRGGYGSLPNQAAAYVNPGFGAYGQSSPSMSPQPGQPGVGGLANPHGNKRAKME